MVERSEVDENKRATLRRFAVLGAATPLAKFRDDGESGESEARDAIAGYVATTPGAHFSKVRDDLKLGTGEAQHHLRQLLEAGVVESRRDGDYRRFYPAEQFSSFEQVALGYLRRDTPRGMLVELLRDPSATGSDLADALDVSRPTVSKYAADLEDAGLLDREDGYAVRNPETVITLLVRYADSFGETAATFAAEADGFISFDP
ncbi:ArsR family transcriptional regulator [Halorussus limi]|uniref:ArsR family transcriptional regulator n=1 Tax=Halorussus limi TaxID=2938695 RepID=A0A8U0HPY2_9EURY|nr:ArsR family transcriptional regulator [Halorussus limi]UPV73020.1 ArsR family transcriptional regulator [Halorussus limi]